MDLIVLGSAIVYVAAFLIALFWLIKRKVGIEKYIISAACMISGARLYEIIFHYLFTGAFNNILQDVLSISLNVPTCANMALCPASLGPFPIVGAILIVSMPFAFFRMMRINRVFIIALVAVVILFAFWHYIGYPQYWNPSWFPQLTPAINIVQNNTASIMLWGAIMALATKITCLLPALLFWGTDDKDRAAGSLKKKPEKEIKHITHKDGRIFSSATKLLGAASLFLILLIGTGSALSATNSNWTSFTLNYNNTRFQPNSTINASNVANLTEAWQINTAPVTSTPIVFNGNVYFDDFSGNVYSLNLMTNKLNWISPFKGIAISSTPAVDNGMVFVSYCYPNCKPAVVALSQQTGKIIWKNTLPTAMNALYASPIVYNGTVYIGVAGDHNSDENSTFALGEIFALNESNGNIKWDFYTVPANDTGGDGVWSSVAIDPKLNSIYFDTGNPYANATGTNTLYGYAIMSLNATTGKLNWYWQAYNSTVNGDDNDFGSTPNLFSFLYHNITYQAVGAGNKNGVYYILNRLNGKPIENFTIGTKYGSGILGLAGVIYHGQNNPELFIPAQYNKSGRFGNGGAVEAVFPSNRTVAWKFYTVGDIIGSISIVKGAVLFGDNLSNFYVLNISNGNVIYHKNFSSGIWAGVTPADGYVFIPLSAAYKTSEKLSGLVAFDLASNSTATTPIFIANTTTVTTSVATTTIVPVNTVGSPNGKPVPIANIPAQEPPMLVLLVAIIIVAVLAAWRVLSRRDDKKKKGDKYKRVGKILTIVGLTIFLYIYSAIILLGDVLYNLLTRKYVPIIKSIPFVYYLNTGGVGVLKLGDILLFIGVILAVVGTLLYYFSKTKNMRYSFGKTLFNYSVLVAFLIFFSIYILGQFAYITVHATTNDNGLPRWTNAVTITTCLFRMPNWSLQIPSCYFLNYAELFVFSIIGIIIGYHLYTREVFKNKKHISTENGFGQT